MSSLIVVLRPRFGALSGHPPLMTNCTETRCGGEALCLRVHGSGFSIRLMGEKLLAAFAPEGEFASEGLQAIDGDDDTSHGNSA